MTKILIAYEANVGRTQAAAGLLAEKIRSAGIDAKVQHIDKIENDADLAGYDAIILGSPTVLGGMMMKMKDFFSVAEKTDLKSTIGGVFGTSEINEEGPKRAYDIMQKKLKMDMVDDPLIIPKFTSGREINECENYAKKIVSKLNKTKASEKENKSISRA